VRDRTCIVGIGETPYRRWGGITDRSEFGLACDAILAACADAGIAPEDVDGFSSYANDRNDAPRLAAALGCAELRYAGMVWDGGGGGVCAAVAHAAHVIHAGAATCVAVVRSLCQGEYGRFGRVGGRAPARQTPGAGIPAAFAYALPFGLLSPAAMCALIVRRHMHEFGTTHRQMGHVAVAARAHANRNPRAVMHGRALDFDEHASARVIADPFRLHDCCLETDGACALILVSAERARNLRRRPVHILAAAEGGEGSWGASLYTHAAPSPAYPSSNAVPVARRLWEMAGCGPQDVDVVQLYENFSGMVLLALEDFGFCARGEAGPFVEDGKLRWPDGALPLNTAGGNLSEAYIHGLNLVVEGVRQMRGESTAQVADAELCLVGGGPGVAPTSALLLRRG
jgi:acetyl-CoA acetyltransferase